MPKIVINEKDETTSGVITENTDIVFVPGFVNYADADPDVLMEIGELRQFDSISEFVAACGTKPMKLKKNDENGTLVDDTGYIMAKELLASGLSVVYCRLNNQVKGNDLFTAVGDKQPLDWDTAYTSYYESKNGSDIGCTPIAKTTDGKAPTYNSAEVRQLITYETITVDVIDDNGEKVQKDVLNAQNQMEAIFAIENVYGLMDKGNYNVKYLTSGGYPSLFINYEQVTDPLTKEPVVDNQGDPKMQFVTDSALAMKMLNMAETRGDCVALIDYQDLEAVRDDMTTIEDIHDAVTDAFKNSNGEYAAMFAPWAHYNRKTTGGVSDLYLPASFGYLCALANAIKVYPNFLAIAGATRGRIPSLRKIDAHEIIPNSIADQIQDREKNICSINSITQIKPYGDVIWGNRTLKLITEDLVATNFLNLRNMISDIKKVVYSAARALTFEQDSDILWLNFKSRITPLMDRMVSGNGLTGYKIIKDTENVNAKKKGVLCAKIILYPAYAVEDFYITVIMRDADDVTVE